MIDLLSLHKLFLSMHIKKGDTVADFTMGGGGDTLWLSNAVGESGKVYAFDVQPMALEKTRARLQSEHAPENYTLILDSHSNLKNYIHEPIRAGVFNLGWLPGSDKTVTSPAGDDKKGGGGRPFDPRGGRRAAGSGLSGTRGRGKRGRNAGRAVCFLLPL